MNLFTAVLARLHLQLEAGWRMQEQLEPHPWNQQAAKPLRTDQALDTLVANGEPADEGLHAATHTYAMVQDGLKWPVASACRA